MRKSNIADIAIVIPSIRPEIWKIFLENWTELIRKHNANLITVWDGEKPIVQHEEQKYPIEKIMNKQIDLIYNLNDGVRNLGFAYIARYLPNARYIISLDDDVLPFGDTIADHIMALSKKVPLSWMNTTMTDYMRGFPYNIRSEAEVWVSHGLWTNIPDYDAITQLVNGIKPQEFYKGPIPKNILYPHCAMNFAFKREALPYVYQAPMGHKIGLDRFADIWGGIEMKKDLDKLGKAVVSGYAVVNHTRASDVYKNLQKEVKGIELNDHYGENEYFKLFFEKREKWKEWVQKYL